MSLSVTVLDPRQTADFQRVFEICAATIDRSEQKTEAELRACFLNPAYRFMAACEAGVIVGCAICYAPPEQGFWLLEYIAVDPGFQGRGLGARLFDACCAVVGPDANEPLPRPGQPASGQRLVAGIAGRPQPTAASSGAWRGRPATGGARGRPGSTKARIPQDPGLSTSA